MTSANVTKYYIKRNGELVGTHSQHHYCHTHWHRLWKYTPWKEHTITSCWEDEDEAPHWSKPENLADFIKARPPSIGDMKRMIDFIERQKELLEEWRELYGKHPDTPQELREKALKINWFNPA